jgi:DNA-binding response OmpR family regulator
MIVMTKNTIFIVDDEVTIREVVRRYLELEGFLVMEAESGSQAQVLLKEHQPDLLLLDIMLPGVDGLTLARAMRTANGYPDAYRDIPIIMLTSRGNEADRLAGFELGVDDYVAKPFSPRELVARVKAVLRRSKQGVESSEKPVVLGGLEIDPLRRSVLRDGDAVVLTAREFDLLWLFARHPRQVFTREQLLMQVWGYEFYGDESTVTVHIRRLREKIEPNPAHPNYIQTVWGVGYKLEVD